MQLVMALKEDIKKQLSLPPSYLMVGPRSRLGSPHTDLPALTCGVVGVLWSGVQAPRERLEGPVVVQEHVDETLTKLPAGWSPCHLVGSLSYKFCPLAIVSTYCSSLCCRPMWQSDLNRFGLYFIAILFRSSSSEKLRQTEQSTTHTPSDSN